MQELGEVQAVPMGVSRLRVAVPSSVLNAPAQSGHGRMWNAVLAELAPLVDLQVDGGRRCQVWLVDGHGPQHKTRGPVVAQVHEASWDDPATAASVAPQFLASLREHTLPWLARSAAVIVPSAWSAAQVASYGATPVVAAHGVDATVFRPGLERIAGEVLFVGTVQPRKNLPALRKALATLASDGMASASGTSGRSGPGLRGAVGLPALTLTIVAGGAHDRPDSADLLAAGCAPLPGVTVQRATAPTDADLAALMGRCAVFCLPSSAEGFGLPVLEAMACGAPVVVTDRGALPEVVATAGIIIDPTHPTALVDGLRRALADDGTLRGRARDRAMSMPWSRTAALWLGALQDAAG